MGEVKSGKKSGKKRWFIFWRIAGTKRTAYRPCGYQRCNSAPRPGSKKKKTNKSLKSERLQSKKFLISERKWENSIEALTLKTQEHKHRESSKRMLLLSRNRMVITLSLSLPPSLVSFPNDFLSIKNYIMRHWTCRNGFFYRARQIMRWYADWLISWYVREDWIS